MNTTLHVYVKLVQDEDGYPPFRAEELDAIDLGNGRFQIKAIPLFVFGLAHDDVVEATRLSDDDRYWVTSVAVPSGNWVARVILRTGSTVGGEELVERFQQLGCRSYPTTFGLVPVGVGAGTDSAPVLALLEEGQAQGW